MTWVEIDRDEVHRAWRCRLCRRMAVTPLHQERPTSECACRSKR